VGLIVEKEGRGRAIINTTIDDYLKDEFCCVIAASSAAVKNHPAVIAKVIRAVQKAALYTEQHPEETARLSIDQHYVVGNADINAEALHAYSYRASVNEAKIAIERNIRDLQRIGLVDKDLNVDAIVRSTFIALPGVEDHIY
jgi:NitT/TauT family transport system substrate-binding protein